MGDFGDEPDIPSEVMKNFALRDPMKELPKDPKKRRLIQKQQEAEDLRYKKQKLKDDKEAEEEQNSRRYTQTNYSSMDSNVRDDVNLNTYYCSHCGVFNLISDVPITKLPKRRSDKAWI